MPKISANEIADLEKCSASILSLTVEVAEVCSRPCRPAGPQNRKNFNPDSDRQQGWAHLYSA